MKTTANIFRYCNVLPSAEIERVAKLGLPLTAVRFLPGFAEAKTWYEAEEFVELTFGEPEPRNDQALIAKTCGACGACCKNIPAHQIGIYASPTEFSKARQLLPHTPLAQGFITTDGHTFAVLNVDHNGDCVALGPKGCRLGDDKPLWCKIYHCEKYQGRPYQFEEKK